jgi:hypothetical protein
MLWRHIGLLCKRAVNGTLAQQAGMPPSLMMVPA